MLTRRIFAFGVAAAGFTSAAPGHAASAHDFDAKAFADAQQAGRPIFIAIHARCCPVCLVQKLIVNALLLDRKYDGLIYFVADFDRQKYQVRQFGVLKQSTLIVFRGRYERGRSTGETNHESIAELMARLL